jgi:hypothetical protein
VYEESRTTNQRSELKKEVKDFMGGKFRAITQVSLALLLALSLSLVTAVSVIAAEFPSISPTTAEYDLDDPAEVMTTIDWGNASSHPIIEKITDDQGDLTPGLGNDYIVLVKHLIILDKYLNNKLTDIGDEVELIIHFDVGAAAFTITAIGTQPSISTTTSQYDLNDRDDVETTITWGIADNVTSITENGSLLTRGVDYTVGATVGGEATLTVLNSTYLFDELTDIGESIELTINFNVGDDAKFTITSTGTQPSIDPVTADYDFDDRPDVKTTITYGTARNVTSITENGNLLPPAGHYTVGATVGGEATLTILDAYLTDELTDIGESIELTIEFDVGTNATFTITATGSQPYIDPKTAEYNLDLDFEDRKDIKTTITWGDATSVAPPVDDDDGHILTTPSQYTLIGTNLTIRNAYLAEKLKDIGDKVVLTLDFDVGANSTFTITAAGVKPKVSPATKEYDLDNATNATTTITWNTAKNITSIVDNDNYTLVEDEDYTLTPDTDSVTLTILNDPYIEGKHMDIGESVVLTIDFNVGADATFTITATGIQPKIFPTTGTYDILAWNDVTTTITWGSAKSVVSIVDDDGLTLADGIDYTVIDIDPQVSANLTILSSTYLEDKLKKFGEEVTLTIGFDVGNDATLTISVPKICFIATAAYGTPMAEEIQVLREFRDEYLLTNPLGQALVGTYYRVSPPIAQFIIGHPSLKPLVRAGLLPVVAMSTVAVNTTPVEKTAIVGSLVLVLVALSVWAIRRRGRGPEYT